MTKQDSPASCLAMDGFAAVFGKGVQLSISGSPCDESEHIFQLPYFSG